jgi:acyl-coenzyme A synthetase/AMP-(fatty) acid ligase
VAVVYALWRIGASAVIADAGLGPQGLRRALRHAAPDHVIGIRRGLLLAKSIHIPGLRIPANRLVDYAAVIDESPEPPVDSEAVVVFTSGATGPAKGVIYTQAQIQRTRDVIARTYDITGDDALVAAFAPWAVLGPTLGISSAIPDMDVTNPRTLTARAVADATHSVAGTIMWASPAALTNIVATANDLQHPEKLATLRLIMGAGAPVSRSLLQEVQRLIPDADLGTPYGMTEVLPVCDVRLSELQDVGWGNGVLVGHPVEGITIAVRPLDDAGNPSGELVRQPQITGEIYVRAPHMRKSYDRLAAVDMRSAEGWHATGDVGHLDADDRLWIEGRLVHVIVTESGIVTPVGIEQVCELAGETAAIVGIGPRGHQQVVAVITGAHGPLADPDKTGQLRSLVHDQTGIDLAAVLVLPQLPVDIRHQAKIDRHALSEWAEQILAGAS